MKLVIGGVAQGKLDYVLENMIEKTEKYDVCFRCGSSVTVKPADRSSI